MKNNKIKFIKTYHKGESFLFMLRNKVYIGKMFLNNSELYVIFRKRILIIKQEYYFI